MYGVYWANVGNGSIGGGSTVAPGYPPVLSDITQWERQVKFPDLDSLPLEDIFNKMKQSAASRPLTTGMFLTGLFERFHHLIGYEEAFIAMYEEPEAVKDFLAALTEYKITAIDRMIDLADPDIIQLHDDWGMQSNMLLSPDMWREFIKPYIKRFCDHVHKRGKIYEQHSCGYITPIVSELVEIGVDALNPMMVSNDIESLLKQYGDKITLLGGIDNQLIETPGVTEAEVRAEVRRAIDTYFPLGCYIPFISGVSIEEKKQIVNDEINRYGEIVTARLQSDQA